MGSAVASMLSKNGVHCFLVGRSQEKLNDIFSNCYSYGNPCFIFSCDISDMTEIKQCSENAIKSLGGLNYLIHCAGDYNKALADECDLEIWDKILDINLRSTYHFVRNVLQEINKNSGGAVIRINSRDAPHAGIGIQTTQKRAIDGYMEVLFDAMALRTFTYNFTFAPKSKEEQDEVHKIIKLFRFHQAPEHRSDHSMFLGLPSEFDIHYMYQGSAEGEESGENQFYNKIATCVLTSCDVNYTPNGVKSFADGAPTRITMGLTFAETEALTKEKIQQGY